MKDKVMMMYDYIRTRAGIEPWVIEELRIVLDVYLADGCSGCVFYEKEEWEMPCRKCRRNCKDYWRKPDVRNN